MSKRDTIIKTATALFNEKSYNSIGVDRIIAESNVAKMTFYKYFPSKEKLIESCLYKRNSDIQSAILERINTNDLPLVQLRSLFNWYIDWIYTEDFNGCLFKKATMEVVQLYPSVKNPINEYREWLYELVFSILIKIQVQDAAALTNLFLNILDGVINDGTIDKNLINAEKTWSYIKKIIDLEKIEELVAI
ncbi:TetR/AcrR family transcriptional regulator [Acinetobacter baumannii]|uniref:TetR/AcrR family transcriptional regulator n=1 Tax=Acinetobacter baumannii TaxID=470 RepID=UPI00233F6AD5|nr:TetR/AcrR family transcriptional regulator [Acinetobacter baumannii]MDC5536767.1 TetR/AcrR family transcriptional regulator [Acinetobacter baumannii]MDH2533447.1 TetR/AcrR family transcriptional regulator [Acinetobacter baumannii]